MYTMPQTGNDTPAEAAQRAWHQLYCSINTNLDMGDRFRRRGDRGNAAWHYTEAERLTRVAEGRGK